MNKKRILACTEASYLSSGYARYANALLKYLHSTGEFEIMEFAAWGDNNDPRSHSIPWQFYGNLPDRNNQEEVNAYNSNPYNKFGAFRFEEACLRFRPSHILGFRDAWHDQHELTSPFRNFYNLIWMPAVDAIPQKEEWLSWYKQCDAVLTYTEWAKEVLDNVSSNTINTVGTATPVCDTIFKPVNNKDEHKKFMGFDSNMKIVGTVMRNQKRKCFPKLFEAFEKYVTKNNLTDTYLYCHTSYPDDGWDIPHLLKNNNVAHKIIFTYICKNCGNCFPSFFRDGKTICPKCMSNSAGLPNTYVAVNNDVLSAIFNVFDVYVQYSHLEGLGMPAVEAAACGVPILSVNYSAMTEVCNNLCGKLINVKDYAVEMESNRLWAIPDNDHLVSLLEQHFAKTKEERNIMGMLARQNFEIHYNSWERVGRKWYDVINSTNNPKLDWNSPPQILTQKSQINQNCSDTEFVRWLITDVLCEPDKLGTFFESRLIRDLCFGSSNYGTGGLYYNEESCEIADVRTVPFDRNKAYEHCTQLRERKNHWERMRVANV